ncbi:MULTISPECIES: type II toxin-antitoxin system HipA family toxin [Brenneria]|uniref:Type II toxin-antitoxin system HipA family toxin n=1 Tax=Brenneria nigrifluens DSM 30175 = ATCC 13028 TaxID=1121120 RepID=A0A2U1UNQ7_9GAMM|nr:MULTISPECIES: type II toxin-antitoxin system HipA family toxin [Brenneria]EHD19588.1 HipA domain protein [Brenneria sp. EniD312]PWC23310.1 type II toxin-antitoxin system HipA family toxin [Brenneria nigrifluens DSM 30175 = ATCC 13028]QCR02856.1 type II toxin-antitoxin system HipA family toxin [Brenneria nigrifluens DSM 30175 = ATCC 13028]
MTSRKTVNEAYVWIWLPDATKPVVAGLLRRDGDGFIFNYGRSYLERRDAIPIYEPELPLKRGAIPPGTGLKLASALRDAAPDAWGRRVILNRLVGVKGKDMDVGTLDELTYLLESGSDRIGGLDFQASPTEYVPRTAQAASLEELMNAATMVENGVPLTSDLDQALFHGSSLGGARPKAMIEAENRKFIAKFSSSTDTYNVVKAEYIAMRLAADVGLHVAPVHLRHTAGKDVILIERFDRSQAGDGWQRRLMVSALTLFGLDEMMARYASYEELSDIIRHHFDEPQATLRELFGRLVFNIICGNTDDHARNHAAFWDGKSLKLTPAYDICPQNRTGNEATQAMLIIGENRMSNLAVCLSAAPKFRLNESEAIAIITHHIETVRERWTSICDEAALSEVDRKLFWGRMFLNPFIFESTPQAISRLARPYF